MKNWLPKSGIFEKYKACSECLKMPKNHFEQDLYFSVENAWKTDCQNFELFLIGIKKFRNGKSMSEKHSQNIEFLKNKLLAQNA